jgi:hypothetical protein
LICPVWEDDSGPARENKIPMFFKEVMATKIHDKKVGFGDEGN